jgi:hypothetical protein
MITLREIGGGGGRLATGLQIAGCHWPKADHILEMADKNKFALASEKKMAGEIL